MVSGNTPTFRALAKKGVGRPGLSPLPPIIVTAAKDMIGFFFVLARNNADAAANLSFTCCCKITKRMQPTTNAIAAAVKLTLPNGKCRHDCQLQPNDGFL